MLSRERILKLDILTPDDTKILTANNKQFSIPSATNSITGRTEAMLIVKGKNIPEVSRNSELNVMVYMRSGERIKYPGFVSLSTDMQLNVVLRTSRAQVVEERRRYYKISTDIDCVINYIERNGSRTALKDPAVAKISDFNIGGMFLCTCEETFYKNDLLMITMELGGKTVDVTAEILRVQVNAAGETVGYGCRFVNVAPAIEELFAKYVFRVQLERLKNEDDKEFL